MSEIFYRQGIPTERCLAVIGFPDDSDRRQKRAQPDPPGAHLPLPQTKPARRSQSLVDYFIDREIENGIWTCRTIPRNVTNGARLLRPQLRKARGAARRRVHLQLALMGRRQHARQRRHSRLRSIRSLPRSTTKYAKDVDRYSASLAEQRGWPERWSRCSPRRWTSSRPAKKKPEHIQKRRVPARLRPRVRNGTRPAHALADRFHTGTDQLPDEQRAKADSRFRSCPAILRTEKSLGRREASRRLHAQSRVPDSQSAANTAWLLSCRRR